MDDTEGCVSRAVLYYLIILMSSIDFHQWSRVVAWSLAMFQGFNQVLYQIQ